VTEQLFIRLRFLLRLHTQLLLHPIQLQLNQHHQLRLHNPFNPLNQHLHNQLHLFPQCADLTRCQPVLRELLLASLNVFVPKMIPARECAHGKHWCAMYPMVVPPVPFLALIVKSWPVEPQQYCQHYNQHQHRQHQHHTRRTV